MRKHKPGLIFIFATLTLDVFGIGLIVPILPKLVEELIGGGAEQASYIFGWLVGLYALMQLIFAPLIGNLSDRFGRRPVILFSLLGSGLDYFLLAWAPSLSWLFVGRIISGISGANFSAAAAYIADISPPERRSANFGIIGAAAGLGFVFGPALGGLLGHYGLRLPFIAAGCLTLLNCLYGLLILPESLQIHNRRKFQLHEANPIRALLALRRHRLILGLSVCFFFNSLAQAVYPAIWVLYTDYRYGWDTKQTGLSLALVGLMAVVVQGGLTRKIIPWLGERRSILIGFSIMALALVGYGLAPQGWMTYCIIICGSLAGIAIPAVQGMISRNVSDQEQGGMQGSLTALQSIAGAIGPPAATAVFGFFIGSSAPFILPGAPFFFSAGLVAIAAVFGLRSFHHYTEEPHTKA